MVDPVGCCKKSSHDVIGALTSQIHSYKIRKSQFWKGLAELGAQPLWWKFEPLYHTSLVIWQNSSRRTSRSGINDFLSNFSCPKKHFLVSLRRKLGGRSDISIFARHVLMMLWFYLPDWMFWVYIIYIPYHKWLLKIMFHYI